MTMIDSSPKVKSLENKEQDFSRPHSRFPVKQFLACMRASPWGRRAIRTPPPMSFHHSCPASFHILPFQRHMVPHAMLRNNLKSISGEAP